MTKCKPKWKWNQHRDHHSCWYESIRTTSKYHPQISNSNIYHFQRNFPMNHAAVPLGAYIAVFSKSCSTPHLVILQKFVEFHQLVLQVKVLKFRQREYLLLGMNIQDMTWLKPPPVDIVRSTLWWLKTITLFWSLIFLEYPLWNQHNPWQ